MEDHSICGCRRADRGVAVVCCHGAGDEPAGGGYYYHDGGGICGHQQSVGPQRAGGGYGADGLRRRAQPGYIVPGAAQGMVDTLEDPYAKYYTAEEYEAYLASINGEYFGIGLLIGQPDETGCMVLEVYEGGPGEAAGIQAGDRITAVNGEPVGGLSLEEVSAKINGPSGQSELTLQRGEETLTIQVTGDTVNIKTGKQRIIQ